MNKSQELLTGGQSVWYDNIQRRLLENGEMKRMVTAGEIYGVTSNPSIFMNAIAKSRDYDSKLLPLARGGCSPEEIYNQLAIADIQAAADLLMPVYEHSEGRDGFVSLEVSPNLAYDAARTLTDAKRLWQAVNRPNLMIKIPATKAGIPAVTEALAAGLNVNVTLIFSLERYGEVMDAYLSGLEKRLEAGQPIDRIASVASFFVSRVDTNIDARLQQLANVEDARPRFGKAAIANARLAYAEFKRVFAGERFMRLKENGARVQRPLWASTSTKNPAYRDVIYVEELIGPDTVNTIPPQTLTAFLDHGQVRPSLEEDLDAARQLFADLTALGISIQEVTDQLEEEGVKAFADAFRTLLNAIEERVKAVVV